MNSIPKISVETKFNNLYNQNQSTYMSSTSPAFKGAGDKFVKEAAGKQRGKISAAIVAFLASIGILKQTKTETEPATVTITVDEAIVKQEESARQTELEKQKAKEEAEKQAKLEKQRAKEAAAKQAELDKIAAKKAAKLAELEKMGITDVEETDEKTIRFVYQGIAYILKNETADNVNLLRLVKKVVRDDPTVGKYTIKAIRGLEECDCDWGIGEAAHVTEALCQMLEADTELMASPYFIALFEEYVKYMNSAELNEFIDKHTAIALYTQKGAKYIESFKTSNPERYIKIVTPGKLYETEEGKVYLKTYAPEKFEELEMRQMLAENDICILESTNDSAIFTVEGVSYKITYNGSTEADMTKLILGSVKNGSERPKLLPPADTIEVIDYTGEYGHGKLTYKYNGEIHTLEDYENIKDWLVYLAKIRINNSIEAQKQDREYGLFYIKTEELPSGVTVERVLPPISTLEIVDFENRVVKEDEWVPGHYVTVCHDNPLTGQDIPGTEHLEWFSGHYMVGESYQTLTYRYNGKTYKLSRKNSSRESMLKEVQEEIEEMIRRFECAKDQIANPQKTGSKPITYTTDEYGVRHYFNGKKQYPSDWDEGDVYRYERDSYIYKDID